MAYNANNLSLLKSVNDGNYNEWVYKSADAQATVAAANYISNALEMGMKVLDLVKVIDTATPTYSLHTVVSITGSAADLSAGTTVSVS